MSSEIAARVKALRAKLDHPVIDGDGHLVEPAPLFQNYLQKTGGKDLVDAISASCANIQPDRAAIGRPATCAAHGGASATMRRPRYRDGA